ncbi:hydroxymethylglutaryl-CoA reductase, degradative [Lactobacillus reuteri]|uniref:3-hydroxy-3-methylglutaryl coenzyme A reductase n=1 Tax=Limosilactobacillus reuteri TaxID=1598 RepID=A0A6L5P1I8_LIMRT|nr:hydroxymethylglutaryl-CoA reductase, degradative [Limosilactobacillus reuteri]MCC4373207.1 hydroxymethylglutaryl-CoA reductase, degradative [Limosilactobacillus reuteri]MCR1878732.1 hydroxymethylglutaryl-CoA reductase, degradative [Limosilactobacillus reuteri]MRH08066.1 hydroxymethylglutaryl-CoA reductase, degradative [Limosilactobacillus reuteri]
MTDWQHGFYKLSAHDRRQQLTKARQLSPLEEQVLANTSSDLGDELVENYITDYSLPEGVALNITVNNRQYVVPMVVEEPSVIAAASNGAHRVSRSGGFTAPQQDRQLVGQVVLDGVTDKTAVKSWLLEHQDEILTIANQAHPSMQARGGGAKSMKVRTPGDFISVDLGIDVCQAMGANSVNTMAEAVGKWLTDKGFHVITAILSNLATQSLQTATCKVAFRYLATTEMDGKEVAQRIARLSDLAQVDPYRAATHNKGIMNGIDAVMIASGNDWRAIESGAHAYAARDGQYRGLSTWKIQDGYLVGKIVLPLPVGVIGGSIGLNKMTKINYHISQIKSAEELAAVTASVGLAQNLAALRALTTTGIQAGHMKLQYRSLAASVGATPAEVPLVVAQLKQRSHVDQALAKEILSTIRKDQVND